MSANDYLIILVRWVHDMAVVTWVGGNIFFLVVLRPAMRRGGGSPELGRNIGMVFREAVEISLWVLIVTGFILIFDRITVVTSLAYGTALGVKLLLFSVMALIAYALGRRGPRRTDSPIEGGWREILPPRLSGQIQGATSRAGRIFTPTNVIVALGPVLILISILLRFLAED